MRNFLLGFLLILASSSISAQVYYLRGTASPCQWPGNFTSTCQLTDPDNNGIFELTVNLGAAPLGMQEFKIYNQTTDSWFPGGANAWYNHQGGSLTFKINSANNRVEVVGDAVPSLCAPGNWTVPNWTNTTPMTALGGNVWCITVPTPGNYEWKPTFCGSFNSWQPNGGERSVNSGNWGFTTTTPNEQVCVTYNPATGRVTSPTTPVGIFLRGSGPLCGWGNVSPTCRLTDPDNDGVFMLTINLGASPAGLQEFKVYDAAADRWYPSGANAWYDHKGGVLTFKYFSASGEVEVADGNPVAICAPGEINGWNNNTPMRNVSPGVWCYKVANPSTFEWKPTLCGTFSSWQPGTGERSNNSGNWRATTFGKNNDVCVTYDAATGRMRAGAAGIPTMSEWGLLLFALLMLIVGVVTVRQRSAALAGTANAGLSFRHLPFDSPLFTKMLAMTMLAFVAFFAIALQAGYALTNADIPGSILATPLIAYLLTLVTGKK
jgi:hypothetical protein